MYKHCPKCAGTLEERFLEIEERNRLICSKCGFIFYQNPTPAAAVVAVQDGKVLLVRRKYEPCVGEWSLPAGFVECGESVEETAIREMMEETNLDIRLTGLLNVYSGFDESRYNVVLVVYRGEIVGVS